MRNTIYHCDLSFAHVNHRFRRIPFNCREGAPRFWEKGWEDKLKIKAEILSKMFLIHLNLSMGLLSRISETDAADFTER